MRRIVLFVALSLSGLVLAPAAFAGKSSSAEEKPLPKIEKSGISEFDDVFMKAKAIHDNLDGEDAKLKTARTNVNTTLGVAADAPVATAFADLKTKAGGKIKVATSGGGLHLEPSEAVPDNVQTGIDAANKLIDVATASAEAGKQLEPEAKSLAGAVADFPARLLTMGLDPMKLLDAKKIVGNDVKATAATPDRVAKLIKTCEGIFTDVKTAFGA